MTTDDRYTIDKTYEVNCTERELTAKAALARLKLILDTSACLCDERGYVLSTNEMHDEAQTFIRDNLDNRSGLLTEVDYLADALPAAFAQHILDDLKLLWDDQFRRDDISEIAMNLSLCPLHFCDWASCFDDEDAECAPIRLIFPYSHDT